MRTRLSKLTLTSTFGIAVLSIVALSGCDNNSAVNEQSSSINTNTTNADINDANDSSAPITDIDWALVDSGEQAVDPANYDYPFAIDSQNVQDYAEYFDVDNTTAQHNLTVGMASNEALSKVLNQLSDSYTSHKLTDGEAVELIVHTTPEVTASRYEYVFSSDFAKGLVLPIRIVPDGLKDEDAVNVHEGM